MLSWVMGTVHNADRSEEIFGRARFGRRLNLSGYAGFRHWYPSRERGLAKQPTALWSSSDYLTIEFAELSLDQYVVCFGATLNRDDFAHLLERELATACLEVPNSEKHVSKRLQARSSSGCSAPRFGHWSWGTPRPVGSGSGSRPSRRASTASSGDARTRKWPVSRVALIT